MDLINILKFITGIVFLGIGSYQDLKDREITSFLWLLMGIVASIFLIIEYTSDFLYLTVLILIFFLWFIDIKNYENYIDLVFFITLLMLLLFTNEHKFLFVDGVLLLAYKYLYHFGAIGGKADARAIMAISLLNPLYPQLFTNFYSNREIVSIVFPYSLEVIFYAAIINAIIFMIYVLIKNIKNKAEKKLNYIFTHLYVNGEWIKYQTPFIFSMLIAFILSYFFDFFYIF
ncbi:MAG: hypothetical protein ACP5R0_00760 [Thermoplasmata archaeon]